MHSNDFQRLNHVRCENGLANIIAILALNNTNITAVMINASDDTLLLALPAGATSADVIPAHNVHIDEDWSLTGGYPVNAEDVDRILNSTIQALQQLALNLLLVSSSGQKNIT
ncbi:14080_t:CDS:2 [Funneliformis mosseae]|uniref:14080_t:CDS:1 n=1 Tax=Funneliformis mosseae TaxID=27381 RepID=A0A9N8YXS8_FUNMO|nr:14080_t:CDS:2 [Funneliformis mosseae]